MAGKRGVDVVATTCRNKRGPQFSTGGLSGFDGVLISRSASPTGGDNAQVV
jgi:hypothetical protein